MELVLSLRKVDLERSGIHSLGFEIVWDANLAEYAGTCDNLGKFAHVACALKDGKNGRLIVSCHQLTGSDIQDNGGFLKLHFNFKGADVDFEVERVTAGNKAGQMLDIDMNTLDYEVAAGRWAVDWEWMRS